MTSVQIVQLLLVLSTLLLIPYALSGRNGLSPDAHNCSLGRWSFAVNWSLVLLAATFALYLLKMTGIKIISRAVSLPLGYLIGLDLAIHSALVVAQIVETTSGWHDSSLLELLKFVLRRPSVELAKSMARTCGGAALRLVRSNFAYTLPLLSLLVVWCHTPARPSYILCTGAWICYNAIILFCLVQDGRLPYGALDRAPRLCAAMISGLILCGMLLITATLSRIETKRRIRRIRGYVGKNK